VLGNDGSRHVRGGNFRAIYNFIRLCGQSLPVRFQHAAGNCLLDRMPLTICCWHENTTVHAPGNGPFDDNTSQREQTATGWRAN
jgi:hypothetical protein